MKPASIVFLAVSVLLIIGGLITCSSAKKAAAKEGVMLFPEYKDGQSRMTTEFTSDDVTMIDITVDEANVSIIGGAEKSYIEIINYKTNYYTFSKTSRCLSFSEIPDLMSMLKFWESGFSFTGIRNLIYVAKAELGEKQVNVYISDNDPVKRICVNVASGELTVKNIPFNASYSLEIGSGKLKVSSVKTDDSVTIKSGSKSEVTLEGVTPATITAELKNTTFTSDAKTFAQSYTVTAESGSITMTTDLDKTNYNISSKSGKINIWGEEKASPQAAFVDETTEYAFKLTVSAGAGDVNILLPYQY